MKNGKIGMFFNDKFLEFGYEYNYGINYEFDYRRKGDIIEFYDIEEVQKNKSYEFYISSDEKLIKVSIKNRNGDLDYSHVWSDRFDKVDEVFEKQMDWHYSRAIGFSDIDYDISNLVISPHGIFFYSIGNSKLYVRDLKISNKQFKDSEILDNLSYWQINPSDKNFILKYSYDNK